MKQEMRANADAMREEMEKSGRVAVYGIDFETGNAVITPDSEQVLVEVARLLTARSDWNAAVEGHTDNIGAKTANMTLSKLRAAQAGSRLASNRLRTKRASTSFRHSTPSTT